MENPNELPKVVVVAGGFTTAAATGFDSTFSTVDGFTFTEFVVLLGDILNVNEGISFPGVFGGDTSSKTGFG